MKFTIQTPPEHHQATERELERWAEGYDADVDSDRRCFNRDQHFSFDNETGVLTYEGQRHPLRQDGGLDVVWAALHGDRPVPDALFTKKLTLMKLANVTPDGEQWINDWMVTSKDDRQFRRDDAEEMDALGIYSVKQGSKAEELEGTLRGRITATLTEAGGDPSDAMRFVDEFKKTVGDAARYGDSLFEVLNSKDAPEETKRQLMDAAMEISATMPDPRVTMESTLFEQHSMPVFGTLDDVRPEVSVDEDTFRQGNFFYECGKSNPAFIAALATAHLKNLASEMRVAASDVQSQGWGVVRNETAVAVLYDPGKATPKQLREEFAGIVANGGELNLYQQGVMDAQHEIQVTLRVSPLGLLTLPEPDGSPLQPQNWAFEGVENLAQHIHQRRKDGSLIDTDVSEFTRFCKENSLDGVYLDNRPGYIEGGSLSTEHPQDALFCWDAIKETVPETGEVHVYETWICGEPDREQEISNKAREWLSRNGYSPDETRRFPELPEVQISHRAQQALDEVFEAKDKLIGVAIEINERMENKVSQGVEP